MNSLQLKAYETPQAELIVVTDDVVTNSPGEIIDGYKDLEWWGEGFLDE